MSPLSSSSSSSSSSIAHTLRIRLGSNCNEKKPSSNNVRSWDCRVEQPLFLLSSCFLYQNPSLVILSSLCHHLKLLRQEIKSKVTAETSRREWHQQIPVTAVTMPRPTLQRQTPKWRKRKWNCYRQEKSRWEILQQEQRLIEEKNKRKKALLAKAIAERSKRTQAETVKLKRIQKELQALDDMVSADIGILRNRIDQASLDYSYARKRYDKAESEYVAAKLDLQHKTEIKEHLTEHLCTIIQQNELRKARKLEELMQQLEVEADEENLELEIEVERMLQQQEAEAGRQASRSHSHAGTAKESPTPSVAAQESEHANHDVTSATSEQLVQSQNSGTKSHSSVDSQTQAVKVPPGSSPACSAT
ncbi:RAB6-interacting golgin isoform X2 [Melanerpes formicivorus]|uniref:RAB6-interacting golgin isoform X2 n=1 Tax=Melanerpes formicivorus TaxID=211600 RepID=UPI00358FA851